MSKRVVWKFRFEPSGAIEIPDGYRWLAAQEQHDGIACWALVDPDAPTVRRRFVVLPTGGTPLHEPHWQYIGTVQVLSGQIDMHLFDAGAP